MKTLKKKLLAILMVTAVCLSVIPASASANDSLKKVQSNAPATTWRVPVGSFIQDYMTAYWSDDRWQQELTAMKEAGMNMLIFSPSVIDNGSVKTNYPSKLFPNKNMYGKIDTIDACLRNCQKAGMKVLIALNQDPGMFWKFGWNISTTEPDVYRQYWKDNAVISNEVADELYGMYKNKYPDAFYGWYWVHEFWNYTICTNAYEGKKADNSTAADPTVYTDIIAQEGFNPVLDHLTKIDSSMPMLFSSFSNPSLCQKADSITRFWTDIISKTNFRPGDIWAPMDGMGGSVIDLSNLDTYTAATAAAAKANPNLHFWINNEEQIENADNDDEVSLIGRTVKQIGITSKYAESNIFFTWNHFFSPYNTLPGYEQTYLQYVNTGKIETNPPAAVNASTIKVTKQGDESYRIEWTEPSDDVGVAEYNVYKDDIQVDHIHTGRRDTGNAPGVDTFTYVTEPGNYSIEALDFAGNVSPRTSFTVSDTPVDTTTTTTGTTTGTTTTGTTIAGTTATGTTAGSTTGNVTGTTTGTTNAPSTSLTGTQIVSTTPASSDSQTTASEQTTTAAQASNPSTGSTAPTAAILFAVITAGVGFALKSKRK